MNFLQFVKENNISIKSVYAEKNPYMDDSNKMNNYKSTLKYQGRQLTTYFSKGIGLKGEPTADEILNCYQCDIGCIRDGYEYFIDSFGYEDTGKTKKLFRDMVKEESSMKRLLMEKYEEFLELEE